MAGVFDPIHLGHIDFIERTILDNSLDKVYLLVEKNPKHKPVFANYNQRVEMINLAVEKHPKIKVYDCGADSYPISNCLPEIKKIYQPAKLYLLVGHDVADHIKFWPNAGKLLEGVELVIAERNDGITSGKIRNAFSSHQDPAGLDHKIHQYILANHLY